MSPPNCTPSVNNQLTYYKQTQQNQNCDFRVSNPDIEDQILFDLLQERENQLLLKPIKF